jgi:hypothetical protein
VLPATTALQDPPPMKFPLVIASIALTAFCWGIYGPVLHWGQAGMGGGRWRPFICVGLAYFVIAVVAPLIAVSVLGLDADEKYAWTTKGTFWALAGGAAGALGAIGIILAFNFGGSPTYVMPLVFGCAPVVNTLFVVSVNNMWNKLNPMFLAGLILVAVGAVTVLIFAPKSGPHGKPGEKPAEKHAEAEQVTKA